MERNYLIILAGLTTLAALFGALQSMSSLDRHAPHGGRADRILSARAAPLLAAIADISPQPFAGATARSAVDSAGTSTYKYRLLKNVDPCTLNTLGSQGWVPIQFDVVVVASSGSDENCKNAGLYTSLSWVIFQLEPGTASSSPPVIYRFKLMTEVDPCTFTMLGSQGWIISQIGTNPETDRGLDTGQGFDETCKKSGVYDLVDWVLFQLNIPNPAVSLAGSLATSTSVSQVNTSTAFSIVPDSSKVASKSPIIPIVSSAAAPAFQLTLATSSLDSDN